MSDDMRHAGWWNDGKAVAVATLATAAPLATASLPPLTDLAGHLGRYRIMLDHGAWPLSQWYHFQWRLVGNLGVDLLVAALAPLAGLEPTVWLACVFIATATALACFALSREVHGHVTPFAYFALPLVWNPSFLTGFLNYSFAMSGTLWAFWLWLRLERAGRTRLRALLFAPIGCLLWVAHVYGWAVLSLLVFGAELSRWRHLPAGAVRRMIIVGVRCLPLALPALLLLLWRSGAHGGFTTMFFIPQGKLLAIFGVLRDRWMTWDILSALLVLAALVYGLRSPAVRTSPRLMVGAGLMTVAFILLPHWLFASAFADARLVPYALMVALLACDPDDRVAPRIALAGALFAALRIVGATASMGLYGADWHRELAAIDRIRPASRVISIVADDCADPWRANRLDHLGGVALARRRVFSNDQWHLPGAALVRIDHPAAGRFAHDPSQLLSCAEQAADPTYARLFRDLPTSAFDYLWLLRPPVTAGRPDGFRLVWSNGRSRLYARDDRADGATP